MPADLGLASSTLGKLASFELDGRSLLDVEMVLKLNQYGNGHRQAGFRLHLPCCGTELTSHRDSLPCCNLCGSALSPQSAKQLKINLGTNGKKRFYDGKFMRRFLAYHLNFFNPSWTILENSLIVEEIAIYLDEALRQRPPRDRSWFIERPTL